ncbi:MAG: phosphatidylinositol transfer protein [Byssovorax sp.]
MLSLPAHRSRLVPLLASSLGLSVAVAACGGSDPNLSGTSGTTAGSTTSGQGGSTSGQGGSSTTSGQGGSSTTTSGQGGGQGGGGTTSGSGGSSAGGGGSGGGACPPVPACDAAPPDPGPAQPWNHTFESPIIVATGAPNHRGRDLFLNPGDTQWIIGKFAYGLIDKDLKEEKVDIWLLRDCGNSWEKLGTAQTTNDNEHATVEGVDDSGGRIYFEVPAAKALGPGRHRVRLVVEGDLSATELFIEVVPPGTPMFVSDVDGTLTDTENAEFGALLTGMLPGVHADAATAYNILASKGYRPMYLTARPDWLTERTRELLAVNGFPPGIVHTTVTLTGATGDAAAAFKTGELAAIAARGLIPTYAVGNTASDATAYDNAGVSPLSDRIFYQFTDSVYGGRRIEAYSELLGEFGGLPLVCP